MKCKKCGSDNAIQKDKILFCPHCGIYAEWELSDIIKRVKDAPQEIKNIAVINKTAANFYFNNLMQDEEALTYLKERGVDKEVIVREGLGLSTPKKSLKRHLLRQGIDVASIKAAGLLNSKGGDKFWDKRILFPIMSTHGKVYGFSGRTLSTNCKYKYVNTGSTEFFDKSSLLYGMHHCKARKAQTPFIVCEGQMDVIALTNAGIANAVATMGTAFTPAHARAVHAFTDVVCLMMDNDAAGQNATRRAAEICVKEGLKVFVTDLGDYKDPDELKKALGAGALKQSLIKSYSLNEWLKENSQTAEELALFI